jgi:PAS domain-containing protein
MNAPMPQIDPPLDHEELTQEYRVLQQFLHLAPVGLMRLREDGEINVMNPMAAQLLGPLGLDRGETNLFDLLEPVSQDIRLLCKTFSDMVGVICDNFRVVLPAASTGADGPWALGITVMRVSAKDDPLMVVVTDQTGALKLQRLQVSFAR